MNNIIFLAYAAIHALLFGWALTQFLSRRTPSSVPLLLVTAGLIYDNGILAAGNAIGAGETLAQLSIPRFFLHAMTTPLLILSAYGLAARAWAKLEGRLMIVLAVVITLAMIATGFWQDVFNLNLELQREGGVLSYGNSSADGAPIAPVVTMLVLLVAGLIVWWKSGIPWLFLGAVAQFAAALFADAAVAVGNFGEAALLAGLLLTHSQMYRSDWRLPILSSARQ